MYFIRYKEWMAFYDPASVVLELLTEDKLELYRDKIIDWYMKFVEDVSEVVEEVYSTLSEAKRMVSVLYHFEEKLICSNLEEMRTTLEEIRKVVEGYTKNTEEISLPTPQIKKFTDLTDYATHHLEEAVKKLRENEQDLYVKRSDIDLSSELLSFFITHQRRPHARGEEKELSKYFLRKKREYTYGDISAGEVIKLFKILK